MCHKCPASGTVEAILLLGALVFLGIFTQTVRLSLKHSARLESSKGITTTSLKIMVAFIFETALLAFDGCAHLPVEVCRHARELWWEERANTLGTPEDLYALLRGLIEAATPLLKGVAEQLADYGDGGAYPEVHVPQYHHQVWSPRRLVQLQRVYITRQTVDEAGRLGKDTVTVEGLAEDTKVSELKEQELANTVWAFTTACELAGGLFATLLLATSVDRPSVTCCITMRAW